MKDKLVWLRLTAVAAVIAAAGSSVGCMTTYDAYGRPMQTVDPGVAIAGVAAAGLVGAAVGSHHAHHGYYGRGYYGGGYYRARPYY